MGRHHRRVSAGPSHTAPPTIPRPVKKYPTEQGGGRAGNGGRSDAAPVRSLTWAGSDDDWPLRPTNGSAQSASPRARSLADHTSLDRRRRAGRHAHAQRRQTGRPGSAAVSGLGRHGGVRRGAGAGSSLKPVGVGRGMLALVVSPEVTAASQAGEGCGAGFCVS